MALFLLCSLMISHFLSRASYIKLINCASNEECIVPCSTTNACSNSIINCPINGNCQIQCNDTQSCREVTVNAPINHHVSVYCGGALSCFNATFYAQQAQSLIITGCESHQSCLYLSIYCPLREINGAKSCFIEGNEWQAMEIYARNGWLDINISSNDTIDLGTMHCTNVTDYDIKCNISENLCLKAHHFCNNVTRISDIDLNRNKFDRTSLLIVLCLICVIIVVYLWLLRSKKKNNIIANNDDKQQSIDHTVNSYYASSQDLELYASTLSSTNPQNHSTKHRKHMYTVSAPVELSSVVQNHINIPSSRSAAAVLHDLHPNDVFDIKAGKEVEGSIEIDINNDKQTGETSIGSVVHLDDNIAETNGMNANETQKEDVILNAMLSDVFEMQNLDPNKIHQINVNNLENQGNDDSDSDSDEIYQ